VTIAMVLMDPRPPPYRGGTPRGVAPLHSFHLIEDLVGDTRRLLESVCVATDFPKIRDEMIYGLAKAIVAVAYIMRAIVHVVLRRSEPYQGENRQLTEQKHEGQERIADNA